MRLLLARHGETGEQYAGRYIGTTDPPLSPRGRGEARRLASLLPTGLSRCLVSPLGRARETAALALIGREVRIEVMEGLREVDFGRWEGLCFAEILDRDPLLVNDWQRDPLAFTFPGGEHTLHFWQRVQEAMRTIVVQPEEEILVIAHGGVLRAMLCGLLALPFDRYLSFAIKPAALTVLEVHGRQGVLQGLNLLASPEEG